MKHRFLRICSGFAAVAAVSSCTFAQPFLLIASADGKTVYDTTLRVRWLANANLAGTDEGRAIASLMGVNGIKHGGSMTYDATALWVNALRNYPNQGRIGYLGHNDWTLPGTPTGGATDSGCTSHGGAGSGFGYGCVGSDMGSLYNISLHSLLNLHWPNSAVPQPDNQVGPFRNFRAYLYWSGDLDRTFSFNTGWAGSNTDVHYMYVLPLVDRKVEWERPHSDPTETPVAVNYVGAGIGTLQVSMDGRFVWDPDAPYTDLTGVHHGVTWLADAALSKSEAFGAQCTDFHPTQDLHSNFPPGIPCISPDGAMANETAQLWIKGMQTHHGVGWLGQPDWMLPQDLGGCDQTHSCFDITAGELYLRQLGLQFGNPVVEPPPVPVGPFNYMQPYLYWSCSASTTIARACDPAVDPVANQSWSFSFGNGMQDTDLKGNSLYVMVYFSQTPAEALAEAIRDDLAGNPHLNEFLAEANVIARSPNAMAKSAQVAVFINHVTMQLGDALTPAQAQELIELAMVN
jgi:hypothetical protein